MPHPKNIFVTSLPGVGKTTLIMKLAERLKPYRLQGFYTEEIREGGERLGFRLRTFGGTEIVLAHKSFRSPHRVGKYGVDVNNFERVLDEAFGLSERCDFTLIDEIAKMECLSTKFRNIVSEILDSEQKVVATIAKRGDEFIQSLKKRNDVELIELTHANRNSMLDELVKHLMRLREVI